MKKKVLKASKIHKSFYRPERVHVLRGIDFEAHSGETIAIMGRSGQGKSTLLQILGTLEAPCDGALEIVGHPVTLFNKSAIRNKHIAFVFQSFHLLDDYTALDNVLMPARIGRRSTAKGSEAYENGLELLKLVGLEERTNFPTKLLSGGERQRVAIARALCNDPDIIFADEPSGNLDKETSKNIHHLLLDFVAKKDKTLIVVTHDQSLADLCSTKYQLEQGFLQS